MASDPPSANSVTMQQVADAAGVSRMTVSRALKDNPRLSQATRERVQRIARELGYQPHPYVSALMGRLSQTRKRPDAANLAVFHFYSLEATIRHGYYHGLMARAQALGFHPELFFYDLTNPHPERLRKILLARGIRGIVLMPALEGFTSIDFDFNGFAAAALGHTVVHPALPRVASDIYEGTFSALDELIRCGYKRIGLVSTEYINRLARFLYSAAILAYRSHIAPHLHFVEHTVVEPNDSETSKEQVKRWILREKLDAIICPTFGYPLPSILKQQGFDIPGDLAYLHLLDYPDDPSVSCLKQTAEFMGAKAVDMVAGMINRNEFRQPPNPYMIATLSEWHEGTTTPTRQSTYPPE